MRYVEFQLKGHWHAISFQSLRPGDIFRMFEEDGSFVKNKDGDSVFKATSRPYFDVQHNYAAWAIECEPYRG